MATRPTTPSSRRKLALIIGNNDYKSRPQSKLRHCVKDANDLSVVLDSIGFRVTTKHDLTNEGMRSTIRSFQECIHDGDLVLFYFAGHGYQVGGENYLMQVDDNTIETDFDVPEYATSAQRTIDRFAERNPSSVTIFILDCCRLYLPKSKPIPRAIDVGTGLNMMDPPRGTFIQFACAPNQIASDGSETDQNGLFTKYLLQHIINPDEDIVQISQQVAADVYDESKGSQKPLSINGLMRRGRVYLNERTATRSGSHEIRSSSLSPHTYMNTRLLELIDHQTNRLGLYLQSKILNYEDMEILGSYLSSNKAIFRVLFLSNNQIGDRGVRCLNDVLKKNKTLKELYLSNNQIGPEGIQYLSDALQNNETLTHLNLSENQIGDQGMEYLSATLEKNTALANLNLSNNQIGYRGMKHLSAALGKNKTLINLNLSNNQIGYRAIRYLSDALKTNDVTLTHLNLSNNQIGDQGMEYLSAALGKNKTLTHLNLSKNQIGDQGMPYLRDALQDNKALTYLDLSNNKIEKQGISCLSNTSRIENRFLEVDFGNNLIMRIGKILWELFGPKLL